MVEKKVYDTIPEGWRVLHNTNTAPIGMMWISNGKSMFDKDYKMALCKICHEKTEQR